MTEAITRFGSQVGIDLKAEPVAASPSATKTTLSSATAESSKNAPTCVETAEKAKKAFGSFMGKCQYFSTFIWPSLKHKIIDFFAAKNFAWAKTVQKEICSELLMPRNLEIDQKYRKKLVRYSKLSEEDKRDLDARRAVAQYKQHRLAVQNSAKAHQRHSALLEQSELDCQPKYALLLKNIANFNAQYGNRYSEIFETLRRIRKNIDIQPDLDSRILELPLRSFENTESIEKEMDSILDELQAICEVYQIPPDSLDSPPVENDQLPPASQFSKLRDRESNLLGLLFDHLVDIDLYARSNNLSLADRTKKTREILKREKGKQIQQMRQTIGYLAYTMHKLDQLEK